MTKDELKVFIQENLFCCNERLDRQKIHQLGQWKLDL
jgi:hypothetical protein